MVDGELEFLDQIDFGTLFDNISEDFDLFEKDFLPLPQEEEVIPSSDVSSSPNSCDSPWMEVEQILMNDDFDDKQVNSEIGDSFFSDLLADAAVVEEDSSAAVVEVRVSDGDCSNPESNVSDDHSCDKGTPCSNPESDDNSSEKGSPNDEEDKEEEQNNDDDPITKKRKRQIRNREAAMRSRERKKELQRDLEMKSIYLENECKRLQHLLHCCYVENHNLHLQIGASMAAKQESAVLFLESLLLGSLLWFLGIVCLLLFPLQGLEVVFPSRRPPANVLVPSLGDSLARVTGNKTTGFGALRLFFKRKRCNVTRSKMREHCILSSLSLGVAPTALVV
ncbi:hypothetical protein MKW94_010354 [Papaver nudicaule]|uniref:BZIP domain-containing protein n=1 Tax=Papaver nudicaule TaxID=74823 RepID=A0AA41S4C4_PAPNU|nr:hypothetical protein [Papaver nudicaule]